MGGGGGGMTFTAKLLQIFGRKFYRNVPKVVFYQPYIFWPIWVT